MSSDLYKDIKQELGHVDIILEPRFEKEYIHFDELYFADSQLIDFKRSSVGYYGYSRHSFSHSSGLHYILSEDKKRFRKDHSRFDLGIKPNNFDGRRISKGSWYSKNYSIIDLTIDKCRINTDDDESLCYYINKVAVINPPYLCPKTGIFWEPQKRDDVVFSDRYWLFKQLPKTRVVWNRNLGFQLNRKTPVCTVNNEKDLFNTKLFSRPTKTAFLSGKEAISIRLGLDVWRYPQEKIEDPRGFLLKQPKPPKFAVIKSAARYLKKRLKVSPLRPSEKKFFQMLGAMAHINNETLNRKKAYAA